MPIDVPVSCACGAVAGVVRGVTPANSRRLACLCDDCQVYARYLGRAHDILDPHGGTDLSYATQDRIEISRGRSQLRGVRLSAQGILRVYAGCCNTPVAHVPSANMAFVGIPHSFMRGAPNGVTRDVLLGPLVYRFQARFCRGEMPSGAHPGTPAWPAAKALLRVAWDSLRGRQRPSVFHEPDTGEPSVPVTVLGSTELSQLRERCGFVAGSAAQRGLARGCS